MTCMNLSAICSSQKYFLPADLLRSASYLLFTKLLHQYVSYLLLTNLFPPSWHAGICRLSAPHKTISTQLTCRNLSSICSSQNYFHPADLHKSVSNLLLTILYPPSWPTIIFQLPVSYKVKVIFQNLSANLSWQNLGLPTRIYYFSYLFQTKFSLTYKRICQLTAPGKVQSYL
jgi:hypothetical protein